MPRFVYDGSSTLDDGTVGVVCGGRVFERIATGVACRPAKPREKVEARRPAALDDLDGLPISLTPKVAYEVVRISPSTAIEIAATDRLALAAFRGERRCNGQAKWREVP